ncbi:uncharacterized protein [Triticum aestivum]|uniref:uncharacterized protein n=1 Tax=Triticum aestivum TaxID=4565 RepID=UPI001D01920C|nr:uncharacterized protein LOC123158302 [Triticum aestivum]
MAAGVNADGPDPAHQPPPPAPEDGADSEDEDYVGGGDKPRWHSQPWPPTAATSSRSLGLGACPRRGANRELRRAAGHRQRCYTASSSGQPAARIEEHHERKMAGQSDGVGVTD